MAVQSQYDDLEWGALSFVPQFHFRIWGGSRLRRLVYADTPWAASIPANCGESWLLSGLSTDASIVANGSWAGKSLPALLETHAESILGARLAKKYGQKFPLMVKLLDTQAPLSIQVHPNDSLAMERHGTLGKSECWYILAASPDSELFLGFNQALSLNAYRQHLSHNTLEKVLHRVHPSAGDFFYVPAGCIHSLGSGLLLLEIQQSAQITYRIEDFGRKEGGQPRALHLAEAESALRFEAYGGQERKAQPLSPNTAHPKAENEHFRVREWVLTAPLSVSPLAECVLYVCVSGTFVWEGAHSCLSVSTGKLILVPAAASAYQLVPQPKATVLEVHIS